MRVYDLTFICQIACSISVCRSRSQSNELHACRVVSFLTKVLPIEALVTNNNYVTGIANRYGFY